MSPASSCCLVLATVMVDTALSVRTDSRHTVSLGLSSSGGAGVYVGDFQQEQVALVHKGMDNQHEKEASSSKVPTKEDIQQLLRDLQELSRRDSSLWPMYDAKAQEYRAAMAKIAQAEQYDPNHSNVEAEEIEGWGCECLDGEPVQFKGHISMSDPKLISCSSHTQCNRGQNIVYGKRCCCVNDGMGHNRPVDLVSERLRVFGSCTGMHHPVYNGFDWTQHCGALCRFPTEAELQAFYTTIRGFDNPEEARAAFDNAMVGVGGLQILPKAEKPYRPAHAGPQRNTSWRARIKDVIKSLTHNYSQPF